MKKNWRTTVAGVLAALALIIPPLIQCVQTGHCDWRGILQAVAGLAVGGGGIAAADGKSVG